MLQFAKPRRSRRSAARLRDKNQTVWNWLWLKEENHDTGTPFQSLYSILALLGRFRTVSFSEVLAFVWHTRCFGGNQIKVHREHCGRCNSELKKYLSWPLLSISAIPVVQLHNGCLRNIFYIKFLHGSYRLQWKRIQNIPARARELDFNLSRNRTMSANIIGNSTHKMGIFILCRHFTWQLLLHKTHPPPTDFTLP